MKQIPPPLCSKCNAEAVLKTGKFGVFYCCPNWPKCEGETISKDDYEKYYKKNHHKKDMVIDAGLTENYSIKKQVDLWMNRIHPCATKYAEESFFDNILERDLFNTDEDFY